MRTLIGLALDLSREMHTIKTLIRLEKEKLKQPVLCDWIENTQVPPILHISRRKLQNLRNSGDLPYSKNSGKIYYKIHDIYSLLESNYRMKSKKLRTQ